MHELLRDSLVLHYGRLHRRLARRLGCADLASECLHEAWLRLGERRADAALRHPEAYVYCVARNIAFDAARGAAAWRCHAEAGDEMASFPDPAPGPALIAEDRSEVAAVDRALRRLPFLHQAVFMAVRVEEMSRQEAARRHGLSTRRIDTLLRQAMAGKPRRHTACNESLALMSR